MRILSIETSCDETAVSVVEAHGDFREAEFTVLGNGLFSQVKLHSQYGGVYPNLAKREHAKNLVPLLREALHAAGLYEEAHIDLSPHLKGELATLLAREPVLFHDLLSLLSSVKKPAIDAIAVTHGPGLEPALWVGINGAKALAEAWGIRLLPTNHMEGHMAASLLEPVEKNTYRIRTVHFPALSLLISGGHTEIILIKEWPHFLRVGATRDDAVGEAFDKAARMLGLPYPGGVHLAQLAAHTRRNAYRVDPFEPAVKISLPRPMLNTPDFDFSFSGLKTAVLYLVRGIPTLTDKVKGKIAMEFEEAATEVLTVKTGRALTHYQARTLIIGGGVSANLTIRQWFEILIKSSFSDVALHLPAPELTTDNAVMIAVAAYLRYITEEQNPAPSDLTLVRAEGNLQLQP